MRIFVSVSFLLVSSLSFAGEPIYNDKFSCSGKYGAINGRDQFAYKNALGEPELIEKIEKWSEKFMYDGLELKFYKPEYGTKYVLSSISVLDSKWKVIDGVNVGDKSERLRGLNEKVGNSEVAKVCGDNDCLEYEINDGIVKRLRLTCYTG